MKRWRVAGIVALCVAAGVVTGILFSEFDRQEFPGATEDDIGIRATQMVAVALVGWLLLPKALSHDPREAAPGFPGTRGTLAASLAVVLASASYFAVPAGVVVLISVFSRRSWPWSLAAVACLGISGLSDVLFHPLPGMGAPSPAMWAAGVSATVALTALIAMFRTHARDEQARVLAEAREDARAARQAERDRIARDVHDSLSHRLSLIALHAGALASRADLPRERVAEASELIRGEAEAAVDDLRSVLRTLDAGDPAPRIPELVSAARAAGTRVDVDGDAELTGAAPGTRAVVARVVQEGLTNARKHAPGAPVSLRLDARGGVLTAEMSNPLDPDAVQSPGAGLGVAGMGERARAAGGSLTSGCSDGFFRWTLRLPLRAEGAR